MFSMEMGDIGIVRFLVLAGLETSLDLGKLEYEIPESGFPCLTSDIIGSKLGNPVLALIAGLSEGDEVIITGD